RRGAKLRGKLRRYSTIYPRPQMPSGIEKAEVIADSLQEQFEPNHVADREVFDQRIRGSCKTS
ncbi:hypothetical protein TNCV_2082371, partial [Trichonephila clavipes]